MVDTDERRRAQRFPLDLPMEVKWQEETEAIQKLASIRDISASGVYFTVDREVRPESKIEFYVQLQMEGAEKGGVLLHCVGSILRVEPDKDEPQRQGVAARIDRYRFLRPGEGPLEAVKEEKHS